MCFETLGSRMYPSHISILRCVSESPGRLSCKRWERRAKTGTPVWHDGLTRRLKSLLRTGPLHALRGSKAAALLPHDDVAALAVSVGLRAHEVAVSQERHREVVGLVLGSLLNDANRRQAYTDE